MDYVALTESVPLATGMGLLVRGPMAPKLSPSMKVSLRSRAYSSTGNETSCLVVASQLTERTSETTEGQFAVPFHHAKPSQFHRPKSFHMRLANNKTAFYLSRLRPCRAPVRSRRHAPTPRSASGHCPSLGSGRWCRPQPTGSFWTSRASAARPPPHDLRFRERPILADRPRA